MKKMPPLLCIFSIMVFAVFMLILPLSTRAAAIHWELYGSGKKLGGTPGNSFTATSLGALSVDVTATAWSEDASTKKFEKAILGQWRSGLGVISDEDGSGSYGRHTVDNLGQQDFIAFLFSAPVIPTDIKLVPFKVENKGPDSDFQAWVGQVSSGFALENMTFAALDAALTRLDENKTSSTSSRTASLSPSGAVGNLLIVRAGVDSIDGPNSREDGFKIKKLYAKTGAPVPEPATMLLLGSGLLGLATAGRRKFFKKNS